MEKKRIIQRLKPRATLKTARLSEAQQRALQNIAVNVREHGQGIGIVFTGAGYDQKIKAAEAIARETSLDLFRIDLSKVVSKFIGETEKNLKRIFAETASTGALLLFDEADALYGKRTEVKDSHDRFANVEINYLLQLIEAHRGGVILGLASRETMDQAFLKRVRFIVEFG